MSQYKLRDAEAPLIENFRRLLSDGGDDNFLIVSCGDTYIQFAAERGDTQIYCEAVSNAYLPRKQQLSDDKIAELQRLGFSPPDESDNFSCIFTIADESAVRRIASLTLHMLANVYGCAESAALDFQLNLE